MGLSSRSRFFYVLYSRLLFGGSSQGQVRDRSEIGQESSQVETKLQGARSRQIFRVVGRGGGGHAFKK